MRYMFKKDFPSLAEVAGLAAKTKVYNGCGSYFEAEAEADPDDEASLWVYAGTPMGSGSVPWTHRVKNLIGMGAVKQDNHGSIIIETEMWSDKDGEDCHRVQSIGQLERLIAERYPSVALEGKDATSWMLVRQ